MPHLDSDLGSLSSYSLNFKSLSDSDSESMPIHDPPPPDDAPQIVQTPDDSISRSGSPEPQHYVAPVAGPSGLFQDDPPYPPTNKFKPLSEILAMPTHGPDNSPQIPSSSEDSYSSSSWKLTDSHSGSTGSDSSSSYATDASMSPSPPQLEHHVPTHDPPLPDNSPQTPSSSEDSLSSNSWQPTDSHSGSTGSDSSSSYATDASTSPSPPQLEHDVSSPASPPGFSKGTLPLGPTDDRPPTSLSESDPPPSAKRPRPEENKLWDSVSKIFKSRIKRRFSGPGALNASQRDLQVSFNSRAY